MTERHELGAISEKVNPAQIAAAKINVAVYREHVKLSRSGEWLTGLCPFHDDRSPSFAVKDGDWICFAGCGRGDAIDFIRRLRNLDFATAVEVLAGRGLEPSPRAARASVLSSSSSTIDGRLSPPASTPLFIQRLWDSAGEDRRAADYLWSRGISLRALPSALRGHGSVFCSETADRRPAMLAAIRSGPQGTLTAIQVTYLRHISYAGDAKGFRETELVIPKRTHGHMLDGAVRLFEPTDTLGLAEGVETAMALRRVELFPTTPVWATAGVSRLPHIWIPSTVKQIILFADRPKDGPSGEPVRLALARAVETYRKSRRYVSVVYPDPPYSDFLEQLNRRAA